LFGGNSAEGPQNDLWAFDAAADTWSTLLTEGDPPTPRRGHDAVCLAGRRAMLAFGGRDEDGDQNDLWQLTFSG
jgi:hypothetical protein